MTRLFMGILLCLALTTVSFAQEADEDEKLDLAVRNFGYTSGIVHSCAMDADKNDIERKVVNYYTEILRTFGSDVAFYYAAAFGTGAGENVEDGRCAEARARFEETVRASLPADK